MIDNYVVSTDDFKPELQKAPRALDADTPFGYMDWFKRQRDPTDQDLVKQVKRVVFACATLNSTTVATHKLRLYVKTNASDRAPRTPTKPVTQKTLEYLSDTVLLGKQFAKVEEVIQHPILTLFQKVNATNLFSEYLLFTFTQYYLETIGRAYWYISSSGIFGQPSEIYILPAQNVTPKREINSTKYVDYYEYDTGTGTERFSPDEIIPFRTIDLNNPYIGGMSPEKAAWEDIIIQAKLSSHLTNTLDNEARPDALITPKEPLSEDIAKLWEMRMRKRFSSGKGGGIHVMEEDANFTPLQWPIRDIARLDINKESKLSIANAYGVPMALLEAQSINRATLEAAMMQHGRYAIRPRHNSIVSILNSPQFIGRWDNSGRLFLAFDDPVPEDETAKLQKVVGLRTAEIITANEAREVYKYPPHPDGDKLVEPKSDGSNERQQARNSGQAEK